MTFNTFAPKFKLILFIAFCAILSANATVQKPKPKKIGKDVRDMNDADLEQLLEQWEVCK